MTGVGATIALTKYIPASTPARLSFGRKDRSPPPMIPGILQMNTHAHRFEALRIPIPTSNVKKMLTIPDGELRRAETGPPKPKPAMRVDEYAMTTPLETACCNSKDAC
jgi:hypothetical protein